MRSIFAKSVPNLDPTEKCWKSDVIKGDRAFVSAKLIAGGMGVFWMEGKSQKAL